jgi:hypothetical protein
VQALNIVREGFQIANRHRQLVVVLWLVPLLPAVVVSAMAAANLAPTLGHSLFADRALVGDWFVVLMEFRSSPADALGPILGRGVVVMALVTLLLQVALSAGIVEVLLEREGRYSFALGIRRNFFRFFRTTLLLTTATLALGIACRFLVKGFFRLAEAQADGRLDVVGVGLAVVVFVVLWAPLDLAADLSRISAARHDHRKMTRGFIRGWWAVIRNPGLFIPVYLAFMLLAVLLHAVYYAARSPWTPATLIAIIALVAAQQTVMVVRAYLRLGFWGAELTAYRTLGQPEWCHPKNVKELTGNAVASGVPVSHAELDTPQ